MYARNYCYTLATHNAYTPYRISSSTDWMETLHAKLPLHNIQKMLLIRAAEESLTHHYGRGSTFVHTVLLDPNRLPMASVRQAVKISGGLKGSSLSDLLHLFAGTD